MESGERNFRDNRPYAFRTCHAPESTKANPSKCLRTRAIHSGRGHLEEKPFAASRSSSSSVIRLSAHQKMMGVVLTFSASLTISHPSGSERISLRKPRSLPLAVLIHKINSSHARGYQP